MALSIVSLVVALVALLVNVSQLMRRPRIVSDWGIVAGDLDGPGRVREGLAIIVTARRRPIEVDEVGIVRLTSSPPRRRQFPEWLHDERPARMPLGNEDLPKRLQDGESLRAYIDIDPAVEWARGAGSVYAYVKASGTVYLAPRDSKLQPWLRGPSGS